MYVLNDLFKLSFLRLSNDFNLQDIGGKYNYIFYLL